MLPSHIIPPLTPSPHPPSPHTAVEHSYQGPRLDGDITAEFMQDLLQWFKEEKKVHKKYAYKVSGESLFSPPSSLFLPSSSLFLPPSSLFLPPSSLFLPPSSLFLPPSSLYSIPPSSFPSFGVEHVFNFLLPPDNSLCEENI